MDLNAAELSILVEELRGKLLGTFIRNVYQLEDSSLILKLVGEEHVYELRIVAGSCLFLVEGSYPKPSAPSKFASQLRHYLDNRRLVDIRQEGAERIVYLDMAKKEHIVRLICELMPPGNIILTEDGKILACLTTFSSKTRRIEIGLNYSPPPPRFSYLPRKLPDDFWNKLREDSPVVAALSRDLGLGGKYAEEVLYRAGVNKQKKIHELTSEDREGIAKALKEIDLEFSNATAILYNVNDEIIFSAIRLHKIENTNIPPIFSSSLNEAIRRAYEHEERKNTIAGLIKPLEDKMIEIEREIGEKSHVISQLDEKRVLLENQLSILSANLQQLEEIRKGNTTTILSGINMLEYGRNKMVLDVYGSQIELRLDTSVGKQLSKLYDELKSVKNAVARLLEEKEKLVKELDVIKKKIANLRVSASAEATLKTQAVISTGRRRFREFVTSEGYHVIAGKDVSSNLYILKKRLEEGDLVFHTEIKGSPAVILKRGIHAGDASLEETAQFTACYSRAWREGFSSTSVYYVKHSQISFSPPPGQYLPRGSFMVYGERHYLTAELALAASLKREDNMIKPIVIPKKTAERQSLTYIEVRPGNTRAEEAASRIVSLLNQQLGLELSRDTIIQLRNEFASLIPYGKCILTQHGKQL